MPRLPKNLDHTGLNLQLPLRPPKGQKRRSEPKKRPTIKKKARRVPKDWETLKSGTLRNGNWHARPYATGWFFYNTTYTKQIGPFDTFEEGLEKWKRAYGS